MKYSIVFLSVVALQGCTTFAYEPLPNAASLSSTATGIRSKLNIGSVGQAAALYNPALIAARTRIPEEEAKVFAAGLLPDPQVSFTFDHPLSNMAGLVNAYSFGLAYDLRAVVLRGETLKAAELASLQVALDVEWQTWQTMQQARDLYIQLAFLDYKQALLRKELDVFRRDVQRLESVLATGDATIDVVSVSVVALSDVENQLQMIRGLRVGINNQLAALLGLSPQAAFSIQRLPRLGTPSSRGIDSLLGTIPERRPDLLALRAGYQSQNSRVRGAILGQFPSLTVGLTGAKDTAGLKTRGFGVTLNLPIFDGNRGAIKVERATRNRLRAEYQARLDASASEVLGLRREINILRSEISQSQGTLIKINRIIQKGANAYRTGDFPAQSYSALLVARYTRELAVADLRQQFWQSVNALVSVLGASASASALHLPGASAIVNAEGGSTSKEK